MAPENQQYTLVGFSAELDWRPLRFVQPIPPHRVCAACGLVRKRTAFLPCTHALCESCYEQCAWDNTRICPLDGHRCDEDDVEMNEFPAEELLKRKVECWNKQSNCGEVLPISQITKHFHQECGYHTICCTKCSAVVLCSDVCTHLRSECCTTAATAASGCEVVTDYKDETALLVTLGQILDRKGDEIKELLERLHAGSGCDSDRLNEVVHGVNNCQEALRDLWNGFNGLSDTMRRELAQGRTEQRDGEKQYFQEIAAFRKEQRELCAANRDTMQMLSSSLHSLKKAMTDEVAKVMLENTQRFFQIVDGINEVKAEITERRKTPDSSDNVLRHTERQVSLCEFFVENFKSLQESALSDGCTQYEGDKAYLCGYYMSPGVVLGEYDEGKMSLHALVHLRYGAMDNVLRWPFQETIKLTLVHPDGGAERVLEQYTPLASRDVPICTATSLNLDDLISDGYVKDDKLRVRYEVLP